MCVSLQFVLWTLRMVAVMGPLFNGASRDHQMRMVRSAVYPLPNSRFVYRSRLALAHTKATLARLRGDQHTVGVAVVYVCDELVSKPRAIAFTYS